VTSLAWTSDGYGLAVGYEHGWAVWSMGGRLGGWGMTEPEAETSVEGFMRGVTDLVGNSKQLSLCSSSGLQETSSSSLAHETRTTVGISVDIR